MSMAISSKLSPVFDQRLNRTAQLSILVALWAVLSFAAAFRWLGEGRDYLEYLKYYETIPYTFSFADTRFEPGFHLVAWIFRVLFNVDYGVFSLVIIGTALGVKFYLIWRYLKAPILAAVTYTAMVYPLHEYTQIRAAFAISIGIFCIHLWMNKRHVICIFGMAVAFLFHSSIVILFAAFMFSEFFKFNKQGIALLIAAVVVVVVAQSLNLSIVSLFSSYNPLISKYIENATFEDEASFFSLGNLLYMSMLALAIYAGWYKDRYRRSFLIMSTLSVFALAVFYSSPTVAQRTKEVLFGAIIFAAYRDSASERDVPALALLWINALALGWLSVKNGLLL